MQELRSDWEFSDEIREDWEYGEVRDFGEDAEMGAASGHPSTQFMQAGGSTDMDEDDDFLEDSLVDWEYGSDRDYGE